jgi:hypothetical protein
VHGLTAAFERHQYGRPAAAGGPAETAASPDPRAAQEIAAVRKALRRNAGPLGRLRAEWLPPSVMSRWGSLAGAPFRAVARAVARAGKAAAGSWTRARDGLRRLREG